MLPISLTIQGVYAYLEEQFIDFEDLTATGLFGIFGPVGAGKSTILEAISVALYGENDRLDTTNFWYNLLNLRSDKAAIVFILNMKAYVISSKHAGEGIQRNFTIYPIRKGTAINGSMKAGYP